MPDLAQISITAFAGLAGAAITAIVGYMANKRKALTAETKIKVDASAVLLDASSDLREFVRRLWDEERQSHLREKESLLDELTGLKNRIAGLEKAKHEDIEKLRDMANREANLIKEIATLQAEGIKQNATIEELRSEVQKLRTVLDARN